MSTDSGDRGVVGAFVEQAKALAAEGQQQTEQHGLFDDAPSPEDLLEAREALGPRASGRAVAAEARQRKRGRPPGAKNKRTDDFARYLLGFGTHPAVTMMQIQATPAEILQQASRRVVTKVLKGRKDEPDTLVEVVEDTLTYEGAQALRVRCAEGLLPYLESKKPTAVDMTFSNLADLMIEGVTHTRAEMDERIEDAEFSAVREEDGR